MQPHTQYAAHLDTNPVASQQQLSKIKEDMKKLQQMKRRSCPSWELQKLSNH